MYICVCNAVSDRHVIEAVRGGVSSFDELMVELGVATACGSCEDAVRQTLSEQLQRLRIELPLHSAA
jgi:bacterioferritin-associated ferredoxin